MLIYKKLNQTFSKMNNFIKQTFVSNYVPTFVDQKQTKT